MDTTLEVVTTIAYHPAGRELHLRNLKWALQNIPHRITVLTYERYGFESLFGERYIEVPGVHGDHYDFHVVHLKKLLDGAPHVLLMQQDVFFHKIVEPADWGMIAHTASEPPAYLGLRNPDRSVAYHRLWEGGVIYSTALLRRAIRDGVYLGYSLTWADLNHGHPAFRDVGYWVGDEFWPIPKWFDDAVRPADWIRGDKMSDLTLYCYVNEIEQSPCLDVSVHFSGPEHTHRHIPDSYSDPEGALVRIAAGEYLRPMAITAPNTALLFHLSGVQARSELTASFLFSTQKDHSWHFGEFCRDVELLAGPAAGWMAPIEYRRLCWARRVIRNARES